MSQKGFTLIELLIAIAIIGVLASFATKSYVDAISKSQMVDAVNGLATLKYIVSENLTIGSCRDKDASQNTVLTKYGQAQVSGFPPELNGSSEEQYGTGCLLTYEFNRDGVSQKLAGRKYLVYLRHDGTYIFNWTNIDKKYIPTSFK